MSTPARRWVSWLLACLWPGRDADPLLGDLDEECALRAASASTGHLHLWYWGQVLRSIPALAWSDTKRAGVLTSLAAALGAFIVASVVEFGADAGVSAFIAPGSQMHTAVSLLGDLAAMALGGYLAALVRPAAATVLAAMLFTLVVVFMVTRPDSVPLWYQIAFLVLGPLASLAGGARSRNATARATWVRHGR